METVYEVTYKGTGLGYNARYLGELGKQYPTVVGWGSDPTKAIRDLNTQRMRFKNRVRAIYQPKKEMRKQNII